LIHWKSYAGLSETKTTGLRGSSHSEPAERLLGAVDAVEGLLAAFSKRVHVDGAELRHVADGRRADAEWRFAINNDQSPHRASPWAPYH
jgi:hypothetical protein